jgi:hypothetical protein
VHGLVSHVALEGSWRRFARIGRLLGRVTLHAASFESYASIFHFFSRHDFAECYHLAAQSFVAESFADGFSTMNTNIPGTHHVLAALRELRPVCPFYFAGSSEMFGKVAETPQTESTRFHPAEPLEHLQCRRLLPDAQLPRGLGHVLLLGQPVQPRKPAAWTPIFHNLFIENHPIRSVLIPPKRSLNLEVRVDASESILPEGNGDS